jgi:hypothetical protein
MNSKYQYIAKYSIKKFDKKPSRGYTSIGNSLNAEKHYMDERFRARIGDVSMSFCVFPRFFYDLG